MRIEELPGTPKIWLDFLSSRLPMLPVPSRIEDLVRYADTVRTCGGRNEDLIRTVSARNATSPQISENMKRLERRDSVVVVADLHAGLFGGPFSQILKCLTVVRLCEELRKHSVTAVPVGWLSADSRPDFPQWSITLLDNDAEIHHLETAPFESVPSERIAVLVSSIRELGHGSFDPEILETVQKSFAPGESLGSASVRLFSALMEEWGMIVLDSGAPEYRPILDETQASLQNRMPKIESATRKQTEALAGKGYSNPVADAALPSVLIYGSTLPVLAQVTDPAEIYSLAIAYAAVDQIGMAMPLAWPRLSATVGDSKTRRILTRHDLDLSLLYSGEEKVLHRIKEALPRDIPGRLQEVESEVERQITEVTSQLSAGNGLPEAAASCREKIVYQLEKLRDHAVGALRSKEQTASRHIRWACNWTAPGGRSQERELAGIQIPLSFSGSGLRRLYENLNLTEFGHQLIWMD